MQMYCDGRDRGMVGGMDISKPGRSRSTPASASSMHAYMHRQINLDVERVWKQSRSLVVIHMVRMPSPRLDFMTTPHSSCSY